MRGNYRNEQYVKFFKLKKLKYFRLGIIFKSNGRICRADKRNRELRIIYQYDSNTSHSELHEM